MPERHLNAAGANDCAQMQSPHMRFRVKQSYCLAGNLKHRGSFLSHRAVQPPFEIRAPAFEARQRYADYERNWNIEKTDPPVAEDDLALMCARSQKALEIGPRDNPALRCLACLPRGSNH